MVYLLSFPQYEMYIFTAVGFWRFTVRLTEYLLIISLQVVYELSYRTFSAKYVHSAVVAP